jgi:flagella basal body P-ring formation protein FlgA
MRLFLCLILSVVPCAVLAQDALAAKAPPAEGTLEGMELARAAIHALQEQVASRKDAEISVDIVSLPKALKVGAGPVELRAELGASQVLSSGRRSVRVQVLRDGVRVESAIVGLDLRLLQDVAVATRRIEVGERLALEDVALERHEITGTLRPPVRLESFTQKQARVMLRPGREIEDRQLEAMQVIRRGDRVVISVVRGALLIRATSEARSDAAAGEAVRLRLVDGGAEVNAIAEGPGLARM